MVHQGVLGFKCEVERAGTAAVTGRAGLVPYLDLMAALGLQERADRRVGLRSRDQGWSAGQLVQALVLLNLSGGDCVDDLAQLEGDEGLCALVRVAEAHGLSRAKRRTLAKRLRRGRKQTFPAAASVHRFLADFHDAEQEAQRVAHKAFIPKAKDPLVGLYDLNADLLGALQRWAPSKVATLDMDATLVASHKQSALYCYKHFQAYQPLNTWWAEQEVVVFSEFRDGNVPAGFEQLRVLKESLTRLPSCVEKVRLRSDTAGYQWDLLRYCAEGQDQRFGVIEFAVGSDVDDAFKKAVHELSDEDWRPLVRPAGGQSISTEQEWAEVCFIPNELGRKKHGPEYRFLAMREPLRQLDLPGTEDLQKTLPFPTIEYRDGRRYKLFGLVTNLTLPGDQVVFWLRERCGKSEEAHAIMKHDLAGGQLPSKLFGANAAWWQLMLLALNLQAIFRRVVLGGRWLNRRLKAFRFGLIHTVARVVHHARRLLVRLSATQEASRLILAARLRILELATAPPG